MGEDEGQRIKSPPNSADMLAMCEWLKIMRDSDGPASEQMKIVADAAGRMFSAWIESLDLGDAQEAGTT
jgi:hypothetical protein